jgi:RsiW-degrading membrane proteinase PrsW (M82 family)
MANFWKNIARVAGVLMVLLGLILAVNSFCIVPLVALGGNTETVVYAVASLTLTALTLGAGWAVFIHADQSLRGRPSKPLRLPPLPAGLGAFAILLALGLYITQNNVLAGLFFPPVFLVLAMLPPLWAVSWFSPPPLHPPILGEAQPKNGGNEGGIETPSETQASRLTWRRGLVAFCGGATVSVFLAVVLEILLPLLILVLIFSTADTVMDSLNALFKGLAGPDVAKALTDPAFIYIFIQVAVIAPLVEELVKPLVTLPLLRQLNRQETFWVGAMAGAGFAALENVLYAAGGFSIWAGIFVVRALGGALHPLGSGLVALGWRDVLRGEPHAFTHWVRQYSIAVLAHAAWNGGSVLVIVLGGAQFFGKLPPEMDILGISMAGTTLAFLLVLGMAGLWIGRAYGHDRPLLATLEGDSDGTAFAPSDRAMALWGLACLLALVPVGITGLRLWLR